MSIHIEDYTVRVGTAAVPGRFQSGSYELDARFSDREVKLTSLHSGELSRTRSTSDRLLTVRETSLVHLVMSVDAADVPTTLAVWMVLSDHSGNVLQRIAVTPGESRSGPNLLLSPGDYLLTFVAADALGRRLPILRFSLQGKGISLPIGPQIVDPTRAPAMPSLGGGVSRPNPPGNNLITSPVIYPGPGSVSVPARPTLVRPPWSDPNWWYWSTMVVAAAP